MAKNNTPTNAGHVHIVIQGKGGCGKTTVANILTQYLGSAGLTPICLDLDPVNNSFARYAAHDAKPVDILQDGHINAAAIDGLIEDLWTKPGPFVIDTGATTFIPFWSYVVENQVFDLLEQQGLHVFVHVVVVGGQGHADTLNGFNSIAQSAPRQNIVVWLNEFFGPIKTADGRSFQEMKVFANNADKVLGTVTIPDRNRFTFGQDVGRMLESALTFDEAIKSAAFGTLSKQRLQIVRRDLFDRIAQVAVV